MMMGCDTLLMVGSAFPYAEFLPKEGAARGVQIDIDASMEPIRLITVKSAGLSKAGSICTRRNLNA